MVTTGHLEESEKTMGIMLKRQVLWRAIVTPQLREEISEDLQEAVDEIEKRIQQLEFSTKAFLASQRGDLQQALEMRRLVEEERKRQEAARDELLQRKAQVEQLQDETEVVRGILEGWVEVNEGDDLMKALGGTEIVTRDGKVIGIRQIDAARAKTVAVAQAASGAGQDRLGQRAPLIITDGDG